MKFAAYLLAGIGLGLGFAYWQIGGQSVGDLSADLSIEDRLPLDRRLSELETTLTLERLERQVLAEELADIKASLAAGAFGNGAVNGGDVSGSNPRERIAALLEQGDRDDPRLNQIRERFQNGVGIVDESAREQRQIERFIDSGLTMERAQYILQREDEIAMEVLQARYEATQSGADAAVIANLSTSQMMRDDLGDADYEKYLAAMGRPTTINVRDVLTNSPAQAAGLAPGDQIVGYDGKRVFDMNELTSLTYEAGPGGTAAIDVIRDGQPMQLYVERGPIGVSGGGRSIRRPR
jgi:hypothetical protein